MELLDRYLQAVRFFLPRGQQDDIIRELKENLVSQMEDREEELGRPLTNDERAGILRRHGHPMLVAGRYRSKQVLIGAAFFPIYIFALKLGLGAAFAVTIVLGAIDALMQGDVVNKIVGSFLAFPGRALMVFAWTTLSFAALDWAQSRIRVWESWDPNHLPRLASRENHLSRFDSLCECLATTAAFVWLLLMPRSPGLVLGPAASIVTLAPIWTTIYPAAIALLLGTMALSLVNFLRPIWTPARSYARIALHATSAAIFIVLLRAGEWVAAKDIAPGNGTSPQRFVEIANRSIEIGLAIALIVGVVEIAREAHRLSNRRKGSHPRPASAAPSPR
jgi:hypothetical protein